MIPGLTASLPLSTSTTTPLATRVVSGPTPRRFGPDGREAVVEYARLNKRHRRSEHHLTRGGPAQVEGRRLGGVSMGLGLFVLIVILVVLASSATDSAIKQDYEEWKRKRR